ncbi:hypothetical protein N5C38_11815 [Pseudomonas chengduensis]|nr:hypothetical protein [Pseudomonas chengduensis]MDH1211736.1 hypothetical protein [Pseudomonas chengduensis]MDH1280636.1 hypothetical protein [Pseudomonas chengduensis]MDH1681151.1 hypothetical protein [Pseudomonas chengduensis]
MESSISGPILVAAAAIAAAAIAGSFSYLNLITAKESKVSEFRQQWIDALRASIAEYLSAFSYISILYKHFSEKDGEKKDRFEMAKEVQDTYSRVNRSYNDIILRINAAESDPEGQKLNDAFLAALAQTREHYNRGRYMEAFRACDAVRDAGKPLLKFEWKRVKRGEPSYNKAKGVAFSVLVAGLVAAVGLAVLVAVGGVAVEQGGESAPLELKARENNPKAPQNQEPNK